MSGISLGWKILIPPASISAVLLEIRYFTPPRAINNAEAIEILVFLGLDINQRGDWGFRPLHEAALLGKVEAYQKLLELGADPSLVTADGWTAHDLLEDVGLRDHPAS